MVKETANIASAPTPTRSWCVEWFGSAGDFLAEGKRQPVSLERLHGLENLYAIGSLEQHPGEISIFDSVPFVSEAWHPTETIDGSRVYRAEFLVYAIVERWHRISIWNRVNTEKELEAALLPRAVIDGIDIDEPFPFLIYGHASRAAGRLLCNLDQDFAFSGKTEPRFSIEDESIEIIGFYSIRHPSVLTPHNSHFHMHLRTLDNRISGHLESIRWDRGFTVEFPANER